MPTGTIRTTIFGHELVFKTAPSLFSPNHVDVGTLAMLSCVELRRGDKVLDLGCGYGVVGIAAAKVVGAESVVMVDNDAVAVALAQENASANGVGEVKVRQSDGFEDFSDTDFSVILINPPYHVDFSVPKRFVHKGFNRMVIGGRFYMVTKRRLWYRNKLIGIFGGVRIEERGGYCMFMAEKRSATYAKVDDPDVIRSKPRRVGA
jgi:16S rRNA (guanine1207-N2)-methyltransferase